MSDAAERPADPRIGVYVCHCGGNISDIVDVEAVTDQVGAEGDVVVARHVPFLCSDEGQTAIERDIAELGLDRVVIAACTPSLHETTFRRAVARAGLNPFLYQHANIREQVSWAHVHDHAAATDKAYRIVRAAIAKAASLHPLDKVQVDAVHRALVLGGGVAGLRAALDLARWGMPVVLVERSAELGGNVLRLRSTYPTDESGRALIERLVADVRAEPLVDLRLRTEVVDVSGFVGDFHVTLRSTDPTPDPDDGTRDEEVGAIVLATGFTDYEPAPGEYGFGGPRVVTLAAYQDRLSGTGSGADLASALALDGPIRSVAFLHCVGSRQVQGVDEPNGELNTYCSRVCCTATLRAAAETRRRFPDVRVVDVYRDLRTYARDQEEVYRAASDAGVLFVRVPDDERARVEMGVPGDPYPLLVRTRDALTFGSELELPVDLVVLATGMKPGGAADVVSMTKSTDRCGRLPRWRSTRSSGPSRARSPGSCSPAPLEARWTSPRARPRRRRQRPRWRRCWPTTRSRWIRSSRRSIRPAARERESASTLAATRERSASRTSSWTRVSFVKRAYVNPVACKGCGACVAVVSESGPSTSRAGRSRSTSRWSTRSSWNRLPRLVSAGSREVVLGMTGGRRSRKPPGSIAAYKERAGQAPAELLERVRVQNHARPPFAGLSRRAAQPLRRSRRSPGSDPPEAFWTLMALRKYGTVVEDGEVDGVRPLRPQREGTEDMSRRGRAVIDPDRGKPDPGAGRFGAIDVAAASTAATAPRCVRSRRTTARSPAA